MKNEKKVEKAGQDFGVLVCFFLTRSFGTSSRKLAGILPCFKRTEDKESDMRKWKEVGMEKVYIEVERRNAEKNREKKGRQNEIVMEKDN